MPTVVSVAALILVTLAEPELATQMLVPSNAMPCGELPTGMHGVVETGCVPVERGDLRRIQAAADHSRGGDPGDLVRTSRR